MDIFKEINTLPQYLYVFDEREMILGGQSAKEATMPFYRLYHLWKQIKELYDKSDLTVEEKISYAKMVQKMARWSQSGTIPKSQLKEKINSLSEKEKEDIMWQIEMYKLGRKYYGEHIS